MSNYSLLRLLYHPKTCSYVSQFLRMSLPKILPGEAMEKASVKSSGYRVGGFGFQD